MPPGFHVTWVGSLIRAAFDGGTEGGGVPLEPLVNEEWFEWHSLVSSIDAAQDRFVCVELGAGYGRWAVSGAVAARRLGLPFYLVCVEAEPSHFAMLRQHFLDNDIDPEQHRLIQAAVSQEDGPVWFTVGQPVDWWGQSILPAQNYGYGDISDVEVQSVSGISLTTALDGIDRVDLIDMDIQGAEADVVESSLALIRDRVKRLHIGTHNPEVEARLRAALTGDFEPVWDFPSGQTVDTPVGHVEFQDGVQAWINKRFRSDSRWMRWLRRQWSRST